MSLILTVGTGAREAKNNKIATPTTATAMAMKPNVRTLTRRLRSAPQCGQISVVPASRPQLGQVDMAGSFVTEMMPKYNTPGACGILQYREKARWTREARRTLPSLARLEAYLHH